MNFNFVFKLKLLSITRHYIKTKRTNQSWINWSCLLQRQKSLFTSLEALSRVEYRFSSGTGCSRDTPGHSSGQYTLYSRTITFSTLCTGVQLCSTPCTVVQSTAVHTVQEYNELQYTLYSRTIPAVNPVQ